MKESPAGAGLSLQLSSGVGIVRTHPSLLADEGVVNWDGEKESPGREVGARRPGRSSGFALAIQNLARLHSQRQYHSQKDNRCDISASGQADMHRLRKKRPRRSRAAHRVTRVFRGTGVQFRSRTIHDAEDSSPDRCRRPRQAKPLPSLTKRNLPTRAASKFAKRCTPGTRALRTTVSKRAPRSW